MIIKQLLKLPKDVILNGINELLNENLTDDLYKYYGYEYADFLQEANFIFEKTLIKYDESKNCLFYTFINLCLRRGLITFCRSISNEAKNKALIYYEDIDQCKIADPKSDINTFLKDRSINDIVLESILKLPMEYSSILELRFNGFNYREISVLLDIPRTTVEYRTRKIKDKVKKYYCKEII